MNPHWAFYSTVKIVIVFEIRSCMRKKKTCSARDVSLTKVREDTLVCGHASRRSKRDNEKNKETGRSRKSCNIYKEGADKYDDILAYTLPLNRKNVLSGKPKIVIIISLHMTPSRHNKNPKIPQKRGGNTPPQGDSYFQKSYKSILVAGVHETALHRLVDSLTNEDPGHA